MRRILGILLLLSLVAPMLLAAGYARADIAKPTTGWSHAVIQGDRPGCAISALFDDSAMLVLETQGDRLTRLIVDAERPLFAPGMNYGTQFTVAPYDLFSSLGKASAVDTIVYDLKFITDVKAALQRGNALYMELSDGDVLSFSLEGLSAALAGAKECAAKDIKVVENAPIAQKANNVAQGGDVSLNPFPLAKDISPENGTLDDLAPIAVSSVDAVPPSKQQAANADEPTSYDLTVRRSDPIMMEGRDTSADIDPRALEQEYTQAPQAQANAGGVDGFIDDQAKIRTANGEKIFWSDVPRAQHWHALNGRNLQDTLSDWARKDQVALVWDTQIKYRLPRSISMQSSFEMAVATLLKMYQRRDADLRPVGTLHIDPETGKRILLIRTERAS